MRLLWLCAMLMAAAVSAQAAESPAVRTARSSATLVTDTDAISRGQPFRAGLRLVMAPGWHTYWRNPGDGGVAPDLAFTLPEGVSASPIAWPAPSLEHEGPLTTFGYTGELLLPVTISGGGGPLPLKLHAEWLICEKICIPESGDFSLTLPAGAPAPSLQAALFASADLRLPRPSPWQARIAPDGTLAVPGLTGASEAWFAAETPDIIEATAPHASLDADGLRIRLKPGTAFRPDAGVTGVLTVRDSGGMDSALLITATPGSAGAASVLEGLPRLMGLAFLGGLILNLMPCVFPVLALKAAGLSAMAGARRRTAVISGLSYTGGILFAFTVLGGVLLAVRAAGGTVGWGFQFQSPGFVAVTAWVLFAVGLNLSGVFAIGGGRLANAGGTLCARPGHVGSFFTGLLAVVVATPCTAPFMGAAVAGALAGPPVAAFAVFLAMGLGLAAPYLALVLVPGVARSLPRPGHWMVVLKQALAFPMYAAAVWLVWVMSQEAGPMGVLSVGAGLLLVGLSGWALGLSQHVHGRGRRVAQVLALTGIAGAAALVPGVVQRLAPAAQAAPQDGSEPFSAARLAELQQSGRAVFVDMTAAWCVTCIVNEQVALAPERVRQAFQQRNVIYMKGDWTRQDQQITAFLRQHGRDGVPLYVFYPANGAPPTVLPQILTQGIVLDAIGRGPG